jgi:catechol 2,3-dioxygenase-like lactoylglutathione lyase family enzyme
MFNSLRSGAILENVVGSLAGLRGNHVCVRVPDFEAGKRWWSATFDFVVIAEWTYEDMRLCKIAPRLFPDVATELVGSGGRRRPTDLADSLRIPGYCHFGFTLDDIAAAGAALEAKGVKFLVPPFLFETLGVRIGFFFDPWGNVFELVEVPRPRPPSNRPTCPHGDNL